MAYVHEFSGLDTRALIAHLASNPSPFSPSALYDTATEEKRIDTELRLSVFRALTDSASFDCAAALVATLRVPQASLTLVRNDVTHIVYSKGGFFKPHQDFLSLVSNCVEEYTLLICALPPEAAGCTVGGETRVTAGGGRVLVSKATTSAGCALLFRKDLVHEGLAVLAGTKEVVALNLWATRLDSAMLLRVIFPPPGSGSVRGGGSSSSVTIPRPSNHCAVCGTPAQAVCNGCKTVVYCNSFCQRTHWKVHKPVCKAAQAAAALAPLRALIQDRSFVLSESTLRATPTCILNGKLHWVGEEGGGSGGGGGGTGDATRVVTFLSPDHTYEEFETVFRALQGMYVRPCDLARHGAALDFFGVPLSSVLVSSVAMGNAGEGDAAVHEQDGFGPGGVPALPLPYVPVLVEGGPGAAATVVGARAAAAPPPPAVKPLPQEILALADEAIMVTTTDERARVVAEAAKALGLPYVRFRAVFAEGRLTYDGDGMWDTPPAKLRMGPVWVTVGDYENLLGCRVILHKGDQGPTELHQFPATFVGEGEGPVGEEEWPEFTGIQGVNAIADGENEWALVDSDSDNRAVWLGLQGCAVTSYFHADPATGVVPPSAPFTLKDTVDFLMPSDHGIVLPAMRLLPGAKDVRSKTEGAFFHVDSRGSTCFSKEEAAAASQHLIDMGFLQHVQSRITHTAFHIPQQTAEKDAHFWCVAGNTLWGELHVRTQTMAYARMRAPFFSQKQLKCPPPPPFLTPLTPPLSPSLLHSPSNENVYGRMNLLTVSGVVRLGPLPMPLPPVPPALLGVGEEEDVVEGNFWGWNDMYLGGLYDLLVI